MKKLFPAGLVSLTLLSCTALTKNTAENTNQPVIENTQWKLIEKNATTITPTLIIEANKVSGNGGCNSYFGKLLVDPKTGFFDVEDIGSTRMACDHMHSESTFFELLEKANTYKLKGNVLELYKNNLLLMKFNKM